MNLILLGFLFSSQAAATPDFGAREVCFVVREVESKKIVRISGGERCEKRFHPYSTFKVALATLAFENGIYSGPKTLIKWDGKKHSRRVLNQDQSPSTYLKYSVNWVSEEIFKKLGPRKIQEGLAKLGFGNHESAKFVIPWNVSNSPVKISALEQTLFWSKLWKGEITSQATASKLRASLKVTNLENGGRFWGKTGTGCLDEGCMSGPGRQLGWYVGVAEIKGRSYAFALNFSDLKPTRGYGGGQARKFARVILEGAGGGWE